MPTGVYFCQQLGHDQALYFDDTGVDEVDELLLKGLHQAVVSDRHAYRKPVVGRVTLGYSSGCPPAISQTSSVKNQDPVFSLRVGVSRGVSHENMASRETDRSNPMGPAVNTEYHRAPHQQMVQHELPSTTIVRF